MTDEKNIEIEEQGIEESHDTNHKEKRKYELKWSQFSLFILLYLGIQIFVGIVIVIMDAILGTEFINLFTIGYIGLLFDTGFFFLALFLMKSVRVFTFKKIDFSVLRSAKTYGYIIASFFFVMIIQYLIIFVLKLENPSAQPEELGFLQVTRGFEYVLLFIAIVILTPIKEEIIYRGILHRFLETRHHFWIGLIVSSLIFGVAHITGGIIITPTIMGIAFVVLFKVTNSLVPGIILHMLWNLLAYITIITQFNL